MLSLSWGDGSWGCHGVFLFCWQGTCLWALVLLLFRGVFGYWGTNLRAFLRSLSLSLSLSLLSWGLMCLSLLFASLYYTLKLQGLAFQSLSQGVCGVMGGLGLVLWVLWFSCCACFLQHSFIGLLFLCFVLYIISLGSLPHTSPGDQDTGPAF